MLKTEKLTLIVHPMTNGAVAAWKEGFLRGEHTTLYLYYREGAPDEQYVWCTEEGEIVEACSAVTLPGITWRLAVSDDNLMKSDPPHFLTLLS